MTVRCTRLIWFVKWDLWETLMMKFVRSEIQMGDDEQDCEVRKLLSDDDN